MVITNDFDIRMLVKTGNFRDPNIFMSFQRILETLRSFPEFGMIN